MEVWPLRPNWREPIRLTYEFKTEIISSRSGREQRRAQRQTPRKTVSFLATTKDERFRTLQRTIAWQQGPLMALAEWTSAVSSTNAMAIGGDRFSVSEVPSWAQPGLQVILADKDRMRLRTLKTAPALTIAFVETSVNTWPIGTLICPALQGRLKPVLSIHQPIPGAMEGRIEFDVDPGSELPRDTGSPDATYNGREVWLEKINWRDGSDVSFERPIEYVDYGRGRVKAYQPIPFGHTIRTADYLGRTQLGVQRLLAFFERMKGRRGEFYCPSDSYDLIPAATIAGQFLTVDGGETQLAYVNDKVNKAVCFKMIDGTRYYRKVTGITLQGAQSRLTLDSPLPGGNVAASNVEIISWLPLMRHASDSLEIEWMTDRIAPCRMNYQTLEDLPAE